ncbi:matrixin family metalloprotease [Halovenus halobia]|uniref:matrixin family metalloprotease n=1 Tax=Halovenus halobia TaxID=3396622 RepID=UPI003F56C1DB
MRRRTLLTAIGAGAATAGCLGLAPTSSEHPLAGETQSVQVRADSTSPHDLDALAEAALSFWEEHSEQYAGFPVEFEGNNDEPDIVIAYSDSPAGCENVPNYSSQVLGCAPVLDGGSVQRRPITARVVAASRPPGAIRVTTQHEIGHILGLRHNDAPANVMSNRPADRIPEYARRVDVWETVRDIHDRASEATPILNYGIGLYNDGEYEAAALALEIAATDLQAFVTRLDAASEEIDILEATVDVETVAFETLRELFDRLRRRLVVAVGLATALAASARADGQTRQSELDSAIEYTETFNSTEVIQLRDVAVALGLVRAFDAEQPVIESPETPTA